MILSKRDDWLSRQLGREAFKVDVHPAASSDGPPFAEGPVFAYARIGIDDAASFSELIGQGFCLIDTNITFSKPTAPNSADADVRPAKPDDQSRITAMARQAFSCDRFHRDPNIGSDLANDIKGAWVENYFHGLRGTDMLVTTDLSGFNLLIINGDDITIDLIAVDAKHRRKGVAQRLIAAAETMLNGTLRVGTQLSNAPSIRLYQQCGFLFESASYVLHYHSDQSA